MELKSYQKNVIKDLNRFLELLTEKQNIRQAYNTLWEEKGVTLGEFGIAPYHADLCGVPHVCLKVPTGGGKTYIASCSVKPIFDAMPQVHPKAVVWLVPSDAILTQTIAVLQNSEHPYRRRINSDFSNHVEVYTKEQLLNGQNFDPVCVDEQLSIFVLSYDSFRTSKKEGRKAYQENGYLASFSEYKTESRILLAGTDETALIQVIRKLNPVVIVDESHHAVSKLSIEMLENFNPAFILELTATPREKSNIISFVGASQLKREEMVKLPVIVYNRKSQDDVFVSAISLRQKLENEAKRAEEQGGKYIRPIVLFQAEPNNRDESTTYEKIKRILLEIGIPKEQIAIKTADTDEIKKQDLLSKECAIRYIITVNALKEGWDCPFAYILATVANRSSVVDVEQILGRILRMPLAKANESPALNLSYVITSSSDFFRTCEKVVAGLNAAGFSSKDYRGKDECADKENEAEQTNLQIVLNDLMILQKQSNLQDNTSDINTEELKNQLSEIISLGKEGEASQGNTEYFRELEEHTAKMLCDAEATNAECWGKMNDQDMDKFAGIPEEVKDKMKLYFIKNEFLEEVLQLEIPQFVIKTQPTLFSDSESALLEKEDLYKGFTLRDKDIQIDFNSVEAEIAKVDVEDADDGGTPKAFQLKGYDNIHMKEWFDTQPSEKKRRLCKDMICKRISKNNAIHDSELNEYISRIMENMTEDQLTDLEQSYYPYMVAIEKKVASLLSEYAFAQFRKLIEQEHILCKPSYHFAETIAPIRTIRSIPKSLYTEEEQFDNEYEKKVVWELSALDNIKWWHRNIARKGFAINGAVTAYPDFIVMTTSGIVLLVETKGDQLKNDESKIKAEIGAKWAAKASMTGRLYKYYMVFQTKNPDYEGACSYNRFMEIVRGL